MTTEFFVLVSTFLAVPAILSKLLRTDRLLPLVFVQILFGMAMRTEGLGHWLASIGIDPLRGTSLPSVEGIGWLGISLLIALTGAEVVPELADRTSRRFLPISVVGFGVTMAAGTLFGVTLFGIDPTLAGPTGLPLPFAMSIGLCLSVTALPVLVGIVKDTGLIACRAGRTAVMSAVLDDLWLWVSLSSILALAGATHQRPLATFLLVAVYVVVMFAAVRPLLRRLHERKARSVGPAEGLLLILLSAAATQTMGIHPFIGAFVGGAMLPAGTYDEWGRQLSTHVKAILVPVFFVLTGVHLQISWGSADFWGLVAAFTCIAVVVKGAAVAIVAKVTGLQWREAFLLGALMQCKGLMELVAITILRDAGVLSDRTFSALAVMALGSTFITAPLISLVANRRTWQPGSLAVGPIA